MTKSSTTQPLILLENEDIKFVEEDFSSSSSEKQPTSSVKNKNSTLDTKAQIPIQNKEPKDQDRKDAEYAEIIVTPDTKTQIPIQNKEPKDQSRKDPQYAEIIVIPDTPETQRAGCKSMERLKLPSASEFPTSSAPSFSSLRSNKSYILNILSHNSSFRTRKKSRHRQEYETVSVRDEDSNYSNASANSTKSAKETSSFMRRKISGSNNEVRKHELKPEDDEQILETLRQVVRKCTNPDPMKRPSSKDLLYLVDATHDKS